MKVLVTGAAGFLGRAMAERLRQQGHRVLGLDLLQPKEKAPHADDRLVDINDAAALRKVFVEFRP